MAKVPTSRIDKLLSSMGYGSRAEMARLAKAGGITLDGAEVEDVSQRIAVTPDLPARMQVDGEGLDPLPGVVILLNKPLGMTCSHKEDGPLVYDLLPARWRRRDPAISTVGRLDRPRASSSSPMTATSCTASSAPAATSAKPTAPPSPAR